MDICETCHYSDNSVLGRCTVCKFNNPPGIDNWVAKEPTEQPADAKTCGNCDADRKWPAYILCKECQASGDLIHHEPIT